MDNSISKDGSAPTFGNTSRHRDTLASLNFKVPLRLRQQFKSCAAQHNVTMTQLLLRLLHEFFEQERARANPDSMEADR